jgi:tetrahydromethanopterin S-methyltransferase subunit E
MLLGEPFPQAVSKFVWHLSIGACGEAVGIIWSDLFGVRFLMLSFEFASVFDDKF